MPNYDYDIFEKVSGDKPVWRCCVHGQEAAKQKVEELAAHTRNEVFAIRLPTKEVIARANAKSA